MQAIYQKDLVSHVSVDKGKIALPFITVFAAFLLSIMFGELDALVYVFFIGISVLYGLLLNKYNNSPKLCFGLMLIFVLYLTAFIGCRDFGVGTDTLVYIDDYWQDANYVKNLNDFNDFDYVSKAFLVLSLIGHLFSNDHQALLIITAFVINFITFLSVYIFNYKKLQINWVVYITIWQFLLMNNSMNLMRQYCSLSFMLLALVLCLKRKFVIAAICAFIGYEFHSTSLILSLLIVYYFLDRRFKPRKRNFITILILIGLLIIVYSAFYYIGWLVSNGILNLHFEGYTNNDTAEGHNMFGISYLAMSFLFIYLALYLRKKKFISNSEQYYLITIYGTSIILRAAAFSLVFLARLSESYNYIIYFILGYLLTKFSNKIPITVQFMIYIVILYFWFKEIIIMGGTESYPYRSVILNIK